MSFVISGFAVGFVFERDILLLLTPPLYFSITYILLSYLIKELDEKTLNKFVLITCSFLSFYLGFLLAASFGEVEENKMSHLAFAVINSLVGGSIFQFYIWRNIKIWWKYLLIPVNTLFAGWLFSLFWSYKLHGLAYYIGLKNYRYHDSFSSWFIIVGSITVIIRMFFQRTNSKR